MLGGCERNEWWLLRESERQREREIERSAKRVSCSLEMCASYLIIAPPPPLIIAMAPTFDSCINARCTTHMEVEGAYFGAGW